MGLMPPASRLLQALVHQEIRTEVMGSSSDLLSVAARIKAAGESGQRRNP